MIEHYIVPAIGAVPLRSLHTEMLDRFYDELRTAGGSDGHGLAPKTVYDVHVLIRAALNQAVRQHLVPLNVAHGAQPPRPTSRSRTGPECWTATQLTQFLAATQHLRLHPALHLAATTGMRRGELAGLRWGDWHTDMTSSSKASTRNKTEAAVVGEREMVHVRSAARSRALHFDAEIAPTR